MRCTSWQRRETDADGQLRQRSRRSGLRSDCSLTSFLMNATFRFPFESRNTLPSAGPPSSPVSPLQAAARCFSLCVREVSWSGAGACGLSLPSGSGRVVVGLAKGTERRREDSILAPGQKVRICWRSCESADWVDYQLSAHLLSNTLTLEVATSRGRLPTNTVRRFRSSRLSSGGT